MRLFFVFLVLFAAFRAFANSPQDQSAALDACLMQNGSAPYACTAEVLSFCSTTNERLEKQFCLSHLEEQWREEFSETLKQSALNDYNFDWDWLSAEYLVRASSLETRCKSHLHGKLDVLNLEELHVLSACKALVMGYSKHLLTDQSKVIEAWREKFLAQVEKTTRCVLDARATGLGKLCIGLFRDWQSKADTDRGLEAVREIVLWNAVSRKLGFGLIDFEREKIHFDEAMQDCAQDADPEACTVEAVAELVLERVTQP